MKRMAPLTLLWALAAMPVAAETLLERGTYLMRSIVACGNCHTVQTPDGPAPGGELAGGLAIKFDEFDAYPSNITPDVATGIGTWTDGQIIAAIREGRRPDGSIIGPPMPIGLYSRISDGDAKAIVAYLRSVPALSNKIPKSVYRIPLPPSYGPPVAGVPEVSRDDPVAYGAYLAGPLGHCLECHTPFVKGRPDFDNALGAGGFEFPGPWGVSVSSNITPHADDGIADYSDAELKTVITTGVRPGGSRLLPPMGIAYYRNISDADLDALVAYLRSLKPLPSP
ncbi:MAG: cytochrome C [Rhodospirillales bacterium]|nr:cytochrome C [Rhodospirillales bacterium]